MRYSVYIPISVVCVVFSRHQRHHGLFVKFAELVCFFSSWELHMVVVIFLYRTLAVPRTRTTLGDRSFAVAGPRVWNSLPAAIGLRQITGYGQFSQYLKSHLFRAYKLQRTVTRLLCAMQILLFTYLLTYLLTHKCTLECRGAESVCVVRTERRVDLQRRQEEILAERESQDVEILPTVAERSQHLREDFPLAHVLRVHQDHAVCTHPRSPPTQPSHLLVILYVNVRMRRIKINARLLCTWLLLA